MNITNIRCDNTAIVFTDCQIDFISGTLGTKEAEEAMPNVVRLARLPIKYRGRTMDSHDENYEETLEGQELPIPHTIVGTEGWQNPPELRELLDKNCATITKETFGSIDLADALQELPEYIEQIVFCGFCTDICVVANALVAQAATRGRVKIIVVKDACAGTTPELHKAALKVLKSCQAEIVTTDEIIRQLTETE